MLRKKITEIMGKIRPYQVCTRCVMDTSDPLITFDERGMCNHCMTFDDVTSKVWFPNAEGALRLGKMVELIKRAGVDKEYDCIIGLSGGVDSSYVAIKASQWGLRPLILHVDTGWNTEVAVANIEGILKHGKYDLHTVVVDWEEMRDLQVAYLRSGIANQDVPQDHIIAATIYHYAARSGIRFVVSGGNIVTEGIFPSSWHGSSMDATNLCAIYRKYGSRSLNNLNKMSFFDYYVRYPFFSKIRVVRPLNFMPYRVCEAVDELEATVGWKPYMRKHGESHFTKVFQNHILVERYGYDKRRPHLSSRILTNDLSRSSAIDQLCTPLYDPKELDEDIEYLCKKLQIRRSDFDEFMQLPKKHYSEFSNWDRSLRLAKAAQFTLEWVTSRPFRVYS